MCAREKRGRIKRFCNTRRHGCCRTMSCWVPPSAQLQVSLQLALCECVMMRLRCFCLLRAHLPFPPPSPKISLHRRPRGGRIYGTGRHHTGFNFLAPTKQHRRRKAAKKKTEKNILWRPSSGVRPTQADAPIKQHQRWKKTKNSDVVRRHTRKRCVWLSLTGFVRRWWRGRC